MKKPVTIENLPLMWANGASFQEVLAAHAHLLAEKIRADRYSLCSEPYGLDAVFAAANVIDPEVTGE
jgi:hypothetical protein